MKQETRTIALKAKADVAALERGVALMTRELRQRDGVISKQATEILKLKATVETLRSKLTKEELRG